MTLKLGYVVKTFWDPFQDFVSKFTFQTQNISILVFSVSTATSPSTSDSDSIFTFVLWLLLETLNTKTFSSLNQIDLLRCTSIVWAMPLHQKPFSLISLNKSKPQTFCSRGKAFGTGSPEYRWDYLFRYWTERHHKHPFTLCQLSN